MSNFYLPWNASNARKRDAERARKNRAEIIRELSWGRVSRRDLIKWGLFTSAGLLAPVGGLNPFVGSASASGDGIPRSPLVRRQGVQAADAAVRRPAAPRHHRPEPVLPARGEHDADRRRPAARRRLRALRGAAAGNGVGAPAVRSVPAADLRRSETAAGAHEHQLRPAGAVEPELGDRSVAADAAAVRTRDADPGSHLGVDVQRDDPAQAGAGPYGEALLFRHFNGLDPDIRKNSGFGRHTISTHEHNGHHGAENDGFTGAYFFPGQFYDYHWPIVLAGHFSMNTGATDPRRAPRMAAAG